MTVTTLAAQEDPSMLDSIPYATWLFGSGTITGIVAGILTLWTWGLLPG